MIISKTPCRMSFVGGGSDIAAFYERFGGAVVSTTIDKFVYVTINPKFDNRIRLSYSRTEEVDSTREIGHAILRETLQMMRIESGVEITSIADIPSQGSGLGSSSSFTVGLLNALFAFKGRHATPDMLGRLACQVEIEKCGQPIGKQDQYAAAFGGFNLIRFQEDGSVVTSPLVCSRRTMDQLQSGLLMFYTGVTRSANDILSTETEALRDNAPTTQVMRHIVELAYRMSDALRADSIDGFGEILHESWMLKRQLTQGITSNGIDHWYAAARRAGAIGGKILGAGGGGFLLLYAPVARHREIELALHDLRRIPFSFEAEGSRIIFYNPRQPHVGEELAQLIA